jgi:hypothetical protein
VRGEVCEALIVILFLILEFLIAKAQRAQSFFLLIFLGFSAVETIEPQSRKVSQSFFLLIFLGVSAVRKKCETHPEECLFCF